MFWRAVIVLASIGLAVPLSAEGEPGPDTLHDATQGLWALQPDIEYAPERTRWRYKSPGRRTGFWARGAVGEVEAPEGFGYEEQISRCYEERQIHVLDSKIKETEFWYFQSGHEGLVLTRRRTLTGIDNCQARYRYNATLQRVLVGEHGFQIFTQMPDGSYKVESWQFNEKWNTSRKDIYMGNSFDPATYLAMRKRELSDSDVGGEIGRLKTHCISYNSPPDAGGIQCWIGSSGPSQGLVTYDMQALVGYPYVRQELTMVENSKALDGRLFEWGRTIQLADIP